MTHDHRRHRHIDIAELVRRGRRLAEAASAQAAGAEEVAGAPDRLRTVEAFGPNPGALRMRCFLPEGLATGAPLLVALHGCTQTAAGFDRGCGWSTLAEERGFALLLPEQRQANNPNRCFRWFEPAHTARDGAGEAASILSMVRHMLATHGLDPARVHVTGLSAGGAMAAALLATRPEVFAGGAIVAGLPHGAAAGLPQAFEAMGSPRARPPGAWTSAAADHAGPWPRIAIWHGEADATVHPGNGEELVKQWTGLHGLLGATPRHAVGPDGVTSRRWHGPEGTVLIEHHRLAGFGHGLPIRPGSGEGRCGQAMPFILEAAVSAPHAIADFLGLHAPAAGGRVRWSEAAAPLGVVTVGSDGTARLGAGDAPRDEPGEEGPATAIRRALAAAGLLRR